MILPGILIYENWKRSKSDLGTNGKKATIKQLREEIDGMNKKHQALLDDISRITNLYQILKDVDFDVEKAEKVSQFLKKKDDNGLEI